MVSCSAKSFANVVAGTIKRNKKDNSYVNGAVSQRDINNEIKNGDGTDGTTATYTDFYQVTSAPSGIGNITSDPLFVDAANGNFNLRPASPCIDTGTLI